LRTSTIGLSAFSRSSVRNLPSPLTSQVNSGFTPLLILKSVSGAETRNAAVPLPTGAAIGWLAGFRRFRQPEVEYLHRALRSDLDAGFRSRCTMPCAASSAPGICFAMGSGLFEPIDRGDVGKFERSQHLRAETGPGTRRGSRATAAGSLARRRGPAWNRAPGTPRPGRPRHCSTLADSRITSLRGPMRAQGTHIFPRRHSRCASEQVREARGGQTAQPRQFAEPDLTIEIGRNVFKSRLDPWIR
jgi:hypothetical protein